MSEYLRFRSGINRLRLGGPPATRPASSPIGEGPWLPLFWGTFALLLLYIDESAPDMHGVAGTVDRPLVEIPYSELCPGNAKLAELMEEYR